MKVEIIETLENFDPDRWQHLINILTFRNFQKRFQ